MIYEYINEETKDIIEREYSIKDDIPSHIRDNGKMYHRYYGDSSIHIPMNFRATEAHNRPAYGKRSSGEGKRFY